VLVGSEGRRPVGSAHDAVIVDAGQTQPVEKGKSLTHGFDGFFLGGRGDDVADQVDRQLAQHAGWLPRLVSINDALRRVWGVAADARFPQRPRVDHGQVHIAAPQDDGVSGGHIVQIGAGGDARLGPAGLVPALTQDPVAGWRLACPSSQPSSEIGQRCRVCQGQLPQAERPSVEVKVSVGQAGQRQTAAQINKPGVWSSQGSDFGVTPDGQKPLATDGKRGGLGEVGVLGK